MQRVRFGLSGLGGGAKAERTTRRSAMLDWSAAQRGSVQRRMRPRVEEWRRPAGSEDFGRARHGSPAVPGTRRATSRAGETHPRARTDLPVSAPPHPREPQWTKADPACTSRPADNRASPPDRGESARGSRDGIAAHGVPRPDLRSPGTRTGTESRSPRRRDSARGRPPNSGVTSGEASGISSGSWRAQGDGNHREMQGTSAAPIIRCDSEHSMSAVGTVIDHLARSAHCHFRATFAPSTTRKWRDRRAARAQTMSRRRRPLARRCAS